jgi:phospholipid/cholesterol/gamma-HCH transport system ATP-binding protein
MANDRNDAPIVVENLHKSFGAQKVLNGLSFRVERGETLAVLGRSGGGKSVLLKLIIGLQQPDSGSIHVAGEDMSHLGVDKRNEVRKKVGFLFQQAALYDSLTVEQNVDFPLIRHTKMADTDRRKRVHALLEQVGMERDMKKMPSELSGGMQKRVGLARALALDPDILLFDEPTAGLDPITAAEIEKLITDLEQTKDMAAVVVTHDVHGAKEYSDRMVLLQEGKLAAEGNLADMQQSRDDFVIQFLRNSPRR